MNATLISVIPTGVEKPAVCSAGFAFGSFNGSFANLAQGNDSTFVAMTSEKQCRALLDWTGRGARPHMVTYG